MHLKKSTALKLRLLNRAQGVPLELADKTFRTGESILCDGVYRVTHPEHRLPSEITLASGDQFPKCSACDVAVSFRFLRPVTIDPEFRIHLFELPVLKGKSAEIPKEIPRKAA
jgi:hypothetical protein